MSLCIPNFLRLVFIDRSKPDACRGSPSRKFQRFDVDLPDLPFLELCEPHVSLFLIQLEAVGVPSFGEFREFLRLGIKSPQVAAITPYIPQAIHPDASCSSSQSFWSGSHLFASSGRLVFRKFLRFRIELV